MNNGTMARPQETLVKVVSQACQVVVMKVELAIRIPAAVPQTPGAFRRSGNPRM